MENLVLVSLLLFGATLTYGNEKCGRPTILPVLEPGDRIFGGQVAVPHSWPWMAGLYDNDGEHFCGGVLISDLHVLTAAHCICPEQDIKFTVHLGSHKRAEKDPKEVVHEVKEVCVHRHYPCNLANDEGSWPRLNDIAIITLKEKVKFSDAISPVCLPNDQEALPMGSTYYVTGWGSIASKANKWIAPSELKQATVNEIPCTDLEVPAERLICLRSVTGLHTPGDSGGPLVRRRNGVWTLYGLLHTTPSCCENGDGAATRVSHFLKEFIYTYLHDTSLQRRVLCY